MDYLNPQKERRQNIMLFIGYGTIAIAIALTTLVLVYQAYGFGLAKNGELTQSGLTFFSSQPNPATISLNGKVARSQTDTRLNLQEGTYNTVISRTGYQDWKRTIEVEGGKVRHYDYPFLIPSQLKPTKLASFTAAPVLSSQSLDRRWLITQESTDIPVFAVYDLKNPTKAATPLSLPDAVATKGSAQSWLPLEWADDNNHLLLQHTVDGRIEFILLDRTSPEQSINLSTTLTGTYNTITLVNRKYDHYYLYDTATKSLQSASLNQPAAEPVLQHVLAYKSYSDNTILYATTDKAPRGKVLIRLRVGGQDYTLRSAPTDTTYLLNLTKYSDELYVVVGASSENRLYIYEDPVGQLTSGTSTQHTLVQSQVLYVASPNYVSFSTTAQFIMAENGTQFAVYDIENDRGYNYTAKQPLDTPALHATWMDGNRLTYVSGGNAIIFDYDYLNFHGLAANGAAYVPAFGPDYHYLYTIAPAADGQVALNETPLLTAADQ